MKHRLDKTESPLENRFAVCERDSGYFVGLFTKKQLDSIGFKADNFTIQAAMSVDQAISEIEDYVAGNIETISPEQMESGPAIDRMSFTRFLGAILETLIEQNQGRTE